MERECIVCGLKFEGRADARFDKDACRKKFNRTPQDYIAIGDEVVLEEPVKQEAFQFKTKNNKTDSGFYENEDGTLNIRTALQWYDVPLGAIPILSKGEPDMPDYMDGRQYFLWRQNGFKTQDDSPVIVNPYPKMPNVTYDMGGENARKWGA